MYMVTHGGQQRTMWYIKKACIYRRYLLYILMYSRLLNACIYILVALRIYHRTVLVICIHMEIDTIPAEFCKSKSKQDGKKRDIHDSTPLRATPWWHTLKIHSWSVYFFFATIGLQIRLAGGATPNDDRTDSCFTILYRKGRSLLKRYCRGQSSPTVYRRRRFSLNCYCSVQLLPKRCRGVSTSGSYSKRHRKGRFIFQTLP